MNAFHAWFAKFLAKKVRGSVAVAASGSTSKRAVSQCPSAQVAVAEPPPAGTEDAGVLDSDDQSVSSSPREQRNAWRDATKGGQKNKGIIFTTRN